MCKKDKKSYRLGIDLGSTSLGWCMVEINEQNQPCGIINMGVRIFPDGRDAKSKEPLSVARRGYRGQRRNLDRYLLRIRVLIKYLIDNGYLPTDEQNRTDVFKLNPYLLRANALDKELTPAEFARAIIHLAKRRGFRSNRKIMSDKKTAYSQAIANLKQGLESSGARTLGEYLWQRYNDVPHGKDHLRKPIKFRYEINNENPEPIFPLREMVEHEFDQIWDNQSRFSPLYSPAHKEAIHNIIFTQKPLKPQPKGKCQLIPTEDRAPKAHPLFQEFRIRQDLNNLKAIDIFTNDVIELTQEQYEILYNSLSVRKEMTFEAMRKLLFSSKAGDFRFNLETQNRDKLPGNQTAHEIHKKENKEIARLWDSWKEDIRNKVIETIISDLDDEPKLAELAELGISGEVANRLLDLNLPSDYSHLGLRALGLILPYMRKRMIFSAACDAAGLKHSLEYDGRIFDEGNLPYYGELLKRETIELTRKSGDKEADLYGRINNPTVHIALNQLRKVVNALIQKYGSPKEIILELGKDIKLSKAEKERMEKQHRKNTKNNEMIDAFLEECNVLPNSLNRLKAKLWFELGANEIDRRCVYTGHQISVTDLFSHKIEIDHILPKSKTYDDSNANKILCLREANRYKAERSPYEAFGESHDGYKWEDIVIRANNLPDNKKRRFHKDAMESYTDKEEILARMLNDTRYMSRVAMKYMYYIAGDKNVSTITGRHTGLLRNKWGLNAALSDDETKNRNDHRHHAIDAFVIALTTRSLVKRIADRIETSVDRFIANLDPPYPEFSYDLFSAIINDVKVSYKPDQIDTVKLREMNQTGGALVKETPFYIAKEPKSESSNADSRNKYMKFTVRKKVIDISDSDVKRIVKLDLQEELLQLTNTSKGDDFKNELVNLTCKPRYSKRGVQMPFVYKVKLFENKSIDCVIPVKDKRGKVIKYLQSSENLFADIYIADPINHKSKWRIEMVNSYDAHQPGFKPQWKADYPKGKKIMRVFKNDIIALDHSDGNRVFLRVKQIRKNSLFLREINLVSKINGEKDDGDQYGMTKLKELRARKAGIDIIGRVFDPIVNET